MTRAELMDHCVCQDYCADCKYCAVSTEMCVVVCDGTILYPYQYPVAILGNEVPTKREQRRRRISLAYSIFDGAMLGAAIGALAACAAWLLLH